MIYAVLVGLIGLAVWVLTLKVTLANFLERGKEKGKSIGQELEQLGTRLSKIENSTNEQWKDKVHKDYFLTNKKELEQKIEQLRWEVENPTEHVVGGKYKKDEVITKIEVVEVAEFSIRSAYASIFRSDYNEFEEKVLKRRITTTNIKTGAISTWEE